MFDFLEKIQNLKNNNLYRILVNSNNLGKNIIFRNGKKLISFASNDYLALGHNKLLKKSAIKAIKEFGTGSLSSRYICGNNELYLRLENYLTKIKGQEDAVVFSSGYSCMIGVIPALAQKKDLILADKLIHASMIDGAKLSGAKLQRFLHNNLQKCEEILEKERANFENCLILTENIFSMDGDKGDILGLLKLAKKYDCLLLADDAHGLFLPEEKMPKSANFLQAGTFSKSLAGLGGYVCGDKKIIDYLRNFAKSQIYSTALPPAILASNLQALKIIKKENLGQKALDNSEYFCQLVDLPKVQSAIVIIEILDNEKLLQIAKNIENKGFLVSAIRPPTAATSRLRISFNAAHKKKEIKLLAKIILDEIK